MLLKQLFIGKPKTVGKKDAPNPMDREWTSAIFKEPVQGPIYVSKTNLHGDGQADLKNHGGPEKAVFVYPSEHYDYWRKELNGVDISAGGMGENFLLENASESTVCIGDTYQVGEAIVQVSQPRQPCWKPARRYKIKNLALLIQHTGRTGWYLRVIEEGYVEAGQSLRLLNRPFPDWTIARCNEIMHVEKDDLELARNLGDCELLAENWRTTLRNRVEKGVISNIQNRVYGPNNG
ncbi:MOSC domain-containing protein [Lederbergia graminis]|uniref:MOSC domain-containing protein n=1 Tax=Lederbergia graminis TaxID=735518 RepID=A0ABW0LI44_9BACI